MANKRIQDLPIAPSIDGSEEMPINKGGITNKATTSQIKTYLGITLESKDNKESVSISNDVNKYPSSKAVLNAFSDLKGGSTKSLSQIESDYDSKIGKISKRCVDFITDNATTRLQINNTDRTRNFMLSYNIKTEQYIGSTFSDAEWVKDSNWVNFEMFSNKNAANGYVGLDANKQLANELINTNFRKGFGYILGGVSQNASVPNNSKINFGAGDFSVQVYFKPKITNSLNWIMLKLVQGTYWGIFIDVNGLVGIDIVKTGVRTQSVTTKTRLIANNWYHLIASRQGGKILVYLNGVCETVTNELPILNVDNSQSLNIGGQLNYEYFNGNIGLVRLFNRALSQSDVTYYENNGRPDLARLKYVDVITDYGEILRNGTFDNFSVWQRTDASILFEDGKVKFVNTPTQAYIFQIAIKVGKQYRCKYTIDSITQGNIYLEAGNQPSTFRAVSGTYIEELKAADNIYFAVRCNGITSAIIDNASVMQLGCVLELLPENALPTQWLESQNGLNATTFGNPAINTELPVTDYSIVDNVTNNIAIGTANRDYTLPAGYIVDSVCVNSTVALTALQLVNVTTTETLLTGKTVSASANKHLPITADQSSSRVDSTIRLNCAGNTGLGFNIVINIKKCL